MGTLEKLQAAGLADDEKPAPTGDESEVELVLADEQVDDGVVTDDDSDDDPGEQGAAQQHQSGKVEVPKSTLSELRRSRRESREAEQAALLREQEKDRELQEMRAKLDYLSNRVQLKPRYADFASDEDYEAALVDYYRATGNVPGRKQPAPQGQQPQQRQQPEPQQRDYSAAINAHVDRAEKLGITPAKFIAADVAVRKALGDNLTDEIIASMGDGSEKALYVLGTMPDQMAKIQRLLTEDRSGLKAIAEMGKIAGRASIRSTKSISDAPRPTRSPTGGGHGALGDEYAKKEAKLEKSGDVQGLVKLRREARKAAKKG